MKKIKDMGKYMREYMREYIQRDDVKAQRKKYRESAKGKLIYQKSNASFRKRNPTYYNDYLKNLRIERKKKGVCIKCGTKKAKKGYVSCQGCLDINNAYMLKYRIKR